MENLRSTNISTTTLNINGRNIPITRQILAQWVKKKSTTITQLYCLQDNHFNVSEVGGMTVKEMTNIYDVSIDLKNNKKQYKYQVN